MDYRTLWSPSALPPSTDKDWAYIDAWLGAHLPAPPPFERNPSTLSALLSLAAANDAANEAALLAGRVKQKTLTALQTHAAATAAATASVPLTPDGNRALSVLALAAVALDSDSDGDNAAPSAERVAEGVVQLCTSERALQRSTLRVVSQRRELAATLQALRMQLSALDDGAYVPPPGMAAATSEWARTTRHLLRKMEDYDVRAAAAGREFSEGRRGAVTVEGVVEMERGVEELKERVLGLEGRVRGFRGLPPERDLARVEVERVLGELRGLEARREALYDRMVG